VRIDTAIASQINRNLSTQLAAAGQAMKRLSTGQRINQASDDAAGLAISQRLLAEMTAADRGSDNVLDGISMLQTAEGALGQTTEMIHRARELAVQAGNGTLSAEDRAAINMEFQALKQGIDDIARSTEWNTKKLLDGSQTSVNIQSGARDSTTFSLPNASSGALGLSGLDANDAGASIAALGSALESVLSSRSQIGARINGMQKSWEVRQVQSQNMAAATSRIRDADFAKEVTNLTTANIMSQASLAMAAQVQKMNASALSLLR